MLSRWKSQEKAPVYDTCRSEKLYSDLSFYSIQDRELLQSRYAKTTTAAMMAAVGLKRCRNGAMTAWQRADADEPGR